MRPWYIQMLLNQFAFLKMGRCFKMEGSVMSVGGENLNPLVSILDLDNLTKS